MGGFPLRPCGTKCVPSTALCSTIGSKTLKIRVQPAEQSSAHSQLRAGHVIPGIDGVSLTLLSNDGTLEASPAFNYTFTATVRDAHRNVHFPECQEAAEDLPDTIRLSCSRQFSLHSTYVTNDGTFSRAQFDVSASPYSALAYSAMDLQINQHGKCERWLNLKTCLTGKCVPRSDPCKGMYDDLLAGENDMPTSDFSWGFSATDRPWLAGEGKLGYFTISYVASETVPDHHVVLMNPSIPGANGAIYAGRILEFNVHSKDINGVPSQLSFRVEAWSADPTGCCVRTGAVLGTEPKCVSTAPSDSCSLNDDQTGCADTAAESCTYTAPTGDCHGEWVPEEARTSTYPPDVPSGGGACRIVEMDGSSCSATEGLAMNSACSVNKIGKAPFQGPTDSARYCETYLDMTTCASTGKCVPNGAPCASQYDILVRLSKAEPVYLAIESTTFGRSGSILMRDLGEFSIRIRAAAVSAKHSRVRIAAGDDALATIQDNDVFAVSRLHLGGPACIGTDSCALNDAGTGCSTGSASCTGATAATADEATACRRIRIDDSAYCAAASNCVYTAETCAYTTERTALRVAVDVLDEFGNYGLGGTPYTITVDTSYGTVPDAEKTVTPKCETLLSLSTCLTSGRCLRPATTSCNAFDVGINDIFASYDSGIVDTSGGVLVSVITEEHLVASFILYDPANSNPELTPTGVSPEASTITPSNTESRLTVPVDLDLTVQLKGVDAANLPPADTRSYLVKSNLTTTVTTDLDGSNWVVTPLQLGQDGASYHFSFKTDSAGTYTIGASYGGSVIGAVTVYVAAGPMDVGSSFVAGLPSTGLLQAPAAVAIPVSIFDAFGNPRSGGGDARNLGVNVGKDSVELTLPEDSDTVRASFEQSIEPGQVTANLNLNEPGEYTVVVGATAGCSSDGAHDLRGRPLNEFGRESTDTTCPSMIRGSGASVSRCDILPFVGSGNYDGTLRACMAAVEAHSGSCSQSGSHTGITFRAGVDACYADFGWAGSSDCLATGDCVRSNYQPDTQDDFGFATCQASGSGEVAFQSCEPITTAPVNERTMGDFFTYWLSPGYRQSGDQDRTLKGAAGTVPVALDKCELGGWGAGRELLSMKACATAVQDMRAAGSWSHVCKRQTKSAYGSAPNGAEWDAATGTCSALFGYTDAQDVDAGTGSAFCGFSRLGGQPGGGGTVLTFTVGPGGVNESTTDVSIPCACTGGPTGLAHCCSTRLFSARAGVPFKTYITPKDAAGHLVTIASPASDTPELYQNWAVMYTGTGFEEVTDGEGQLSSTLTVDQPGEYVWYATITGTALVSTEASGFFSLTVLPGPIDGDREETLL